MNVAGGVGSNILDEETGTIYSRNVYFISKFTNRRIHKQECFREEWSIEAHKVQFSILFPVAAKHIIDLNR